MSGTSSSWFPIRPRCSTRLGRRRLPMRGAGRKCTPKPQGSRSAAWSRSRSKPAPRRCRCARSLQRRRARRCRSRPARTRCTRSSRSASRSPGRGIQMASYTADVIVVGGGIAGITTALELLDHGRDVLMLDRDAEANFGGLARESFGGLFFVNSREQQRNGIKDSPALALRDWHSFAEFGPDDRLPKLWAETYVER